MSQLSNVSKSEYAFAQPIGIQAAALVIKQTGINYDQFTFAVNNSNPSTGQYAWTPAYPSGFPGAAVAAQTNALYPQLASTVPFTISSSVANFIASQYSPNAVSSLTYQAQVNFTLNYGYSLSTIRSTYDNTSAFFWADGANTSAIGGHWVSSQLFVPMVVH